MIDTTESMFSTDKFRAAAEDHLTMVNDLLVSCEFDFNLLCNYAKTTLRNGGKLVFCGNGGSAADAQHLAAEFTARYEMNRQPLPAIPLTADTASLTACANDFGFHTTLSRHIPLVNNNDFVIALTTSGNSENIVEFMRQCVQKKVKTALLTGEGGGRSADFADVIVNIPSYETARIQEGYMLVGHIFADVLEKVMFDDLETGSTRVLEQVA